MKQIKWRVFFYTNEADWNTAIGGPAPFRSRRVSILFNRTFLRYYYTSTEVDPLGVALSSIYLATSSLLSGNKRIQRGL